MLQQCVIRSRLLVCDGNRYVVNGPLAVIDVSNRAWVWYTCRQVESVHSIVNRHAERRTLFRQRTCTCVCESVTGAVAARVDVLHTEAVLERCHQTIACRAGRRHARLNAAVLGNRSFDPAVHASLVRTATRFAACNSMRTGCQGGCACKGNGSAAAPVARKRQHVLGSYICLTAATTTSSREQF